MNPYMYLSYLALLGKKEVATRAKQFSDSLYSRGGQERYLNFSWLVEQIVSERRASARKRFIFAEELSWVNANSRNFIAFLKKYGLRI